MRKEIKMLLLLTTLGVSSTLVSCDTSISTTNNVLYHIDLESNEFVKLETAINNVASKRKVEVKVTLLNEEVSLLGLEISDGTEIKLKEGTTDIYTFLMPENSITIKAKLDIKEDSSLKLVGTYFASKGVSNNDSINNILKINNDLTYSLIRNNEIDKPSVGSLVRINDYYISNDGKLLLTPIKEDNNLIMLLVRFKDDKLNKSDNLIFASEAHPTINTSAELNEGIVVNFKYANLDKSYFAYFTDAFIKEVEVTNFESNFVRDLTYEIKYDETSLFTRYDGEKLFLASKERGTYKLNTLSDRDIFVNFDGFGNYIYDTTASLESIKKGTYRFDNLNDFAVVKETNNEVYVFDYQNKTVTKKEPNNNLLTGLVYDFETKVVDDKPAYKVKLRFVNDSLIEFKLLDLDYLGYKINQNKLTLALNNGNTLEFNINPLSYELTCTAGYFLNEGDASNLVITPSKLVGPIHNLSDDIVFNFLDTGQYTEKGPAGQEYITSYHLETINGELFVYCGIKIDHFYLKLDLVNATATKVEPIKE